MPLSERHREDQARFGQFCREHVRPLAAQFDASERIGQDLIARLASAGYFGLSLPAEFGGAEAGMLSCGLLHTVLGGACNSTRSLLTVHEMVGYALLRWGAPAQKKTLLPKLAQGELLGALAASEPSAGSDLASIETSAADSGNAYRLNGVKRWISFGQIAGLFMILARCAGGLAVFLVERDTPGLTIQPIAGMLGLRASMLAEITLRDILVDKARMLGRPGFGLSHVLSSALLHGRYTVACGCVGIAERCLELSTAAGLSRTQFGAPLLDHQLVKRMVTDMVTNARAAGLLCREAGGLLDQGDPEAISYTMSAKYLASRVAEESAAQTVQIHGARGCRMESEASRLWRDARIMAIIEGSTEIQQITIADGYRASQMMAAV